MRRKKREATELAQLGRGRDDIEARTAKLAERARMSTSDELEREEGGEDLAARLDAARFAICALLGALERVRDLIAGGYFPEAKAQAEAALLDADAYLRIVDDLADDAGEPV